MPPSSKQFEACRGRNIALRPGDRFMIRRSGHRAAAAEKRCQRWLGGSFDAAEIRRIIDLGRVGPRASEARCRPAGTQRPPPVEAHAP